ncbi:MAG: MipA/OmpV family protein [Rhodospirillales bacterium]|nr:MAG: MipA/OmpV family protein [Rhodospirillales bacterium]
MAAVLWVTPSISADQATEFKPKWEIGIAGAGAWTPHYPAADEGGQRYGAIPYMIYRSRRLKIGEGGLLSGDIFESDRIDITASIRGSLPARSKDNKARAGMPDLDALAEFGPQVVIFLVKRPDVDSISLKLPIRFVASSDFTNLKYRGVVFQPRLAYEHETLFGSGALSGTVSLGPVFATERLMDYFYEVPPQYATPERPAFNADGGYLGSALALGLTYEISDQFSISVGTQLEYYGGATNKNSPLHRSDTGVRAGAALVWKVWTSKSMVPD